MSSAIPDLRRSVTRHCMKGSQRRLSLGYSRLGSRERLRSPSERLRPGLRKRARIHTQIYNCIVLRLTQYLVLESFWFFFIKYTLESSLDRGRARDLGQSSLRFSFLFSLPVSLSRCACTEGLVQSLCLQPSAISKMYSSICMLIF
jgi:hypothetical protein